MMKALTLLQPLKLKYGNAISWADLIILTGDVAIVSMGGPSIGFCAGRVDDADGSASIQLGPSPEQVRHTACTGTGTNRSRLVTLATFLITQFLILSLTCSHRVQSS